jgi:signal transduction histidine kinase/integral membrane sensor domain MASE1
MASTSRTVAALVAVAVAYCVGANLGFILRFPSATPSVMWPPNAILTSTLLLVPPRRWWIYLLFGAFPAHVFSEIGHLSLPLVLALFVTNCSEAVIAAAGVRWLSDAPARFDSLRRMAIFIGAGAFAAPFVSSFLDAAVVTALRGEVYAVVWSTRFFSNVLTELAVVPVIVTLVAGGLSWLRGADFRRRAEAVVLAIVLLTVGSAVFAGPFEGWSGVPGSGTPVAFLLPSILWAAVRFGPGGASASLLTTALLAIWAGTHGRGPFVRLPVQESVFALQIFLIIIAIPLLCLAALIEERRRVQQALSERLRFEELLARLSGAFVHLPVDSMGLAFERWLRHLGEFLQLDRLQLFRFSRDDQALVVAYAWVRPGVELANDVVLRQEFPWLFDRLNRESLAVFSRRGDLPREAVRDAEAFERRGVRSNASIPLEAGGRVMGGLCFATLNSEREWPDELLQRLRLVGEVFASALARKEAEEALRASELSKSAILAALPSGVAVLDRQGNIVAVNESWGCFAKDEGSWATRATVRASYLDVCREAAHEGLSHAAETQVGIEAVLARTKAGFAVEYPWKARVGERWAALSVVPLDGAEGGAVVSVTDITERKQAELDAQRSRQELAHFTRVSTMGELTASLAHELNQPLTGILTNAQAARRFLDATPPALGEVREILTDIVEDDRRAGEVIQRLRDLLRKGEPQRVFLDLHALIHDVVRLLASDAVIRNVTVSLDFAADTVIVSGDRVQLQQVVLNLLLNAMEAMAEERGHARRVVVRTIVVDDEVVRVSLQDAGSGLRPGTEDLIFEPFYTTKEAGMGMGLAIARSIIEAHGGTVGATSNGADGATVYFTLPRVNARVP